MFVRSSMVTVCAVGPKFPSKNISLFLSLRLPPSLSVSLHLRLFSLYLSTGIKTSQAAKFYAVSAAFDKFSNEGKTVVIQFTVKHEQRIDCGGGYVKVRGGARVCVCVCVCVSVCV